MNYQARRELLIRIIPRYREADRNRKRTILDEFVSSTGYSGKYAIRLLYLKNPPLAKEIKETPGTLLWPSGSRNNQIGLVSNKLYCF